MKNDFFLMRKAICLTLMLLVLYETKINAQSNVNKAFNITSSIGYGTENNFGNVAVFGGVTLLKPIRKHLSLEAGLTYFTTVLPDGNKDLRHGYEGIDRKYNALFLTPAASYLFGNEHSLFNARIKFGLAAKIFDYKSYKIGLQRIYSDGRRDFILETVQYYKNTGVNISFYNAVSFDTRISSKLRMGFFLDTYSRLIPIEHFMPGISATFKLGK